MARAESQKAGHRATDRHAAEPVPTDAAPAGTGSPGDVAPGTAAREAPAAGLGPGSVTVIVVTFDSEAEISACLAGIPREPPIHIVDNASQDGTLARIAAFDRPRLRVTRMARNEGFGRACNRALADISTGQALLLNPDAAIAPAALAHLSAVMAAADDVAILAPQVVETGTSPWPAPGVPMSSATCATGESAAGPADRCEVAGPTASRGNGTGAALRDVPEVTGSCMLLDVEKIRRIGFFDESIFLYYEDSDLCWRARAAGFRVCIAADAVATHRSGDSSSAMRTGNLLRERLLGQSYAYFTAKHHPRPRRRIARKALAHLSAGLGCFCAGRPGRGRMRLARMRGMMEYLLSGRRALWANHLAGRIVSRTVV